MTGKYIIVLITACSIKEGKKITEALIRNKLAACVNIIPGVISAYWWKGKIEKAKEVMLVVKTSSAKFKKLVEKVRSVHSYTVPEIISLPITDGNKEYLKWIGESITRK